MDKDRLYLVQWIEPKIDGRRRMTPTECGVQALVARSMTRSEVKLNKKAIEAVQKEWQKLRDKQYEEVIDGKVVKKKGVWDESAVEDLSLIHI